MQCILFSDVCLCPTDVLKADNENAHIQKKTNKNQNIKLLCISRLSTILKYYCSGDCVLSSFSVSI